MIDFRFHGVNARTLASAAISLFVLTTLAIAQEAAPEKQKADATDGVPELALSTTTWDFGTVWSGENVSTTVTLRNTGNAPLKITQVKSSCGCTATKHTKQELAPGETEEIEISYNTKKRTEKVNQTVRITTNDPAHPIETIEVHGTVKQILELDPSYFINIGRVGPDEKTSRSIDIKCNYTEPLNLTMDVLRPTDEMDIQFEELEPGHHYRVTATTKPPLSMGSLRGMVGLNTGLELMPQVIVQVHALVQPPVLVTPVKMMLMEKDTPQIQTLRLTNHTGRPIAITNIKASVPTITTEILPGGTPPKTGTGPAITNIRANFPPTSELPEDVTITVQTDDKGVQRICYSGDQTHRQARRERPKVAPCHQGKGETDPGRPGQTREA